MIIKGIAGLLGLSAAVLALRSERSTAVSEAGVVLDTTRPSGSDYLALLPDGEEKYRFIRDCTGCHGFGEQWARPASGPRGEAGWAAAVERMLGYAGPNSNFRLIGADRDPATTAAWLAQHLDPKPVVRLPRPTNAPATIREFMLPSPGDLPHDVAVDARRHVIITGMFTHQMYDLDPATGNVATVAIPVGNANPRALELDAAGDWWVVLGNPNKIARYRVADRAWDQWDVGMYAHSLALGADGRVWYDGHFTREPPQIGFIRPGNAQATTIDLPRHPVLSDDPTGPVPYEIRVAPNGVIWTGELSGDRLIGYDPATSESRVVLMPPGEMGPRRFDIDSQGIIWIPMYASGSLLRFEPASGAFRRYDLPIKDSSPYVAKLDPARGVLWIGTGSADAVFRLHIASGSIDTYLLPSRGALVRHIAIDANDGSAWLAYGGSPGIATRVARVTPTN
jgi:virginiamycin B lyase